MSRTGRFSASARLVRRLALASVVANVALVVTGGAVRLTSSGLGCPTWPRCTDTSYTTTAEMGVHGVIEFGNRLLGFGVAAVALAGFVAVLLHRPRRRSLVVISGAVLLGIPGQGVIGGITVLTKLNPWVVGLHFLLSMALIAGAYAFWRRAAEPDGPVRATVPAPLRTLIRLTTVVSAAVIVIGVVVTGSGPHAGDRDARRTGLDPQTVAQVHADLVFLLVGLSVAAWFAVRAVDAPAVVVGAVGVLVGVELAQGLIGFVQYATSLPAALVAAHMLGACLVWLATLAALWATRERLPLPAAAPPEPQRAGSGTTGSRPAVSLATGPH